MPYKDPAKEKERQRLRRERGYKAPGVTRNVERVTTLKSITPCKDCQHKFPAVCMDFDHLHSKTNQVSTLAWSGVDWSVVQEEIDKCEIVCSNCHRIRTSVRPYGRPRR